MATIKWRQGLILPLDTHSVRDFTLDFTEWLEGEVLTDSSATGTACTVAKTATATTVKIRVSNVTAGASVLVRVTTNSGQVEDFTISFAPVER